MDRIENPEIYYTFFKQMVIEQLDIDIKEKNLHLTSQQTKINLKWTHKHKYES